jgi:hypothetical protein
MSLIVKTVAFSSRSSARSPSSSERTPTSATGSVDGGDGPRALERGPPRPIAAASTIPCTFPLGLVSGRFRSPWASTQRTPPGASRRRAAERAERDRVVAAEDERQPPSSRAALTRSATRSQAIRISRR